MAFVTNVLILEPIVYCAVLVKEGKTGKRVKLVICATIRGCYLFYIMRACRKEINHMATLSSLLNTIVGIKMFYCTLNHNLYLCSVARSSDSS